MGGVLRNLLLQCMRGLSLPNRDLDLVVGGAASADELRAAVEDYSPHRNDFGGVKCRVRPDGLVFDIWRIEDHVNMSLEEEPASITELLNHNLIDIDAVLLDLETDTLHDAGCLAAIERGVIDLQGTAGISKNFAAAQVAHIVLVARKTGFEVSHNAELFIRERLRIASNRADVVAIMARKLQTEPTHAEEALNSLLQEEPWPTMAN